MKSISDKLEEQDYEENIKSNLVNIITRKLILTIIASKMILKSFELNKIDLQKNKIILLYGKNEGHKNEIISDYN